jgi:hypothetical protein
VDIVFDRILDNNVKIGNCLPDSSLAHVEFREAHVEFREGEDGRL